MQRIRFLYSNLWNATASAVTASASASALPAAASQNPDRTYVWRSSTTTGDQWLAVDLGSALTPTVVAVANIRVHTGGSAKLQHSPDNAAWTDAGDLPTTDADSRVTFLFASATKRYWRIYFTNTLAGSDYVEAGYVFLGTYYEPDVNVSAPLTFDDDDPSVSGQSVDGQETFATRTPFASFGARFDSVSATTLGNLQTVYRTVGKRTPFFLVLDADTSWTAWFGRFADKLTKTFRDVPDFYDVAFTFRESR